MCSPDLIMEVDFNQDDVAPATPGKTTSCPYGHRARREELEHPPRDDDLVHFHLRDGTVTKRVTTPHPHHALIFHSACNCNMGFPTLPIAANLKLLPISHFLLRSFIPSEVTPFASASIAF